MKLKKCFFCNLITNTPIHLTEVKNNECVESADMCDNCGKKYIKSMFEKKKTIKIEYKKEPDLTEINSEEELISFITGMHQPVNETVCDCGWTESDFSRTGRFGCQKCYETFDSKVTSIVFPYHNGSQHVGKLPKKNKNHEVMKDPVEYLKVLKLQLSHAIEFEKYEEAAEIKKKIENLSQTQP